MHSPTSGPGMYDVCLQHEVITTKYCFDWKKNHDESPEKGGIRGTRC